MENMTGKKSGALLNTGRGCPGACVFCSQQHGKKVRVKTAAQIIEEIEGVDEKQMAGELDLQHQKLFFSTDHPVLKDKTGYIMNIFDEDFLLDRERSLEFFRLWSKHPLRGRYRLAFQTNPSTVMKGGEVDEEVFTWFDRMKPFVHFGGESFNPEVLQRWKKRHTVDVLNKVINRMDRIGVDYVVYQLMADQESTAEEFIDTVHLQHNQAYRHPNMMLLTTMMTCPEYDSELRRRLEGKGILRPQHIQSFEDYYQDQKDAVQDPLLLELIEASRADLTVSKVAPGHFQDMSGFMIGQAMIHMQKALEEKREKLPEGDGEIPRINRLIKQIEVTFEERIDAISEGRAKKRQIGDLK
jgi:hypothetical protein